jgi:SAM-dependent methyltransferase
VAVIIAKTTTSPNAFCHEAGKRLGLAMDVVDLKSFYASPLGQTTSSLISSAVFSMLNLRGDQLMLGLGYATPYLQHMNPDATTLSFMLARQGVIHWPAVGPVKSALVDECELPLLESAIDQVLVIHGLELADTPADMLQEIWRVMAPQGRLYIVVPNRRGLWSTTDASPFGYGQPFSRSQLQRLLKDAQFQILQWRHALFMPPLRSQAFLKAGAMLEAAGSFTATRFSGVIVIEAMKQVYAFSSGKKARRFVPRLRPALLPAPQPSRRQWDKPRWD